MLIHTFKPASSILKKYIENFYVLERTAEDPSVSYMTFPKLGTLVSVYADSITDVQHDHITIHHQPGAGLQTRIVGKFDRAIRISYAGAATEINTVFHPLAINAFLPEPFCNYASGPFDDFKPSAEYLLAMQQILDCATPAEKASKMETYWLSQLKGFQHPYLNEIVKDMMTIAGMETSIATYALRFGVSRQTLHEQFCRYTGKSPAEFKKLVRFRHAITREQKLSPDRLSRLSAMACYFDESHMIRNFRDLTGYTPGSFFSRISRKGEAEANWVFL